MAEEAPNQSSRSDPSALERRISSLLVRTITSPARRKLRARLAATRRGLSGGPRQVHYFHEVEEPYSQLAAQTLGELARRYEIELVPHTTARLDGITRPEPELLRDYARRDAAAVAADYGLAFSDPGHPADPALVERGERILAGAEASGRFVELAPRLGAAIWQGDEAALSAFEAEEPGLSPEATREHCKAASALRNRKRHYSGAMFFYEGEWFWGVDRLHHLERRLIEEGAARESLDLAFPRPAAYPGPLRDDGQIVLEYFPSLRSPYTATAHEPTLRLAAESGVRLEIRPVLPMVMRGVPVSLTKALYISEDARREAEAAGVPTGKMHDPIGYPAENGFALWSWACRRGRGNELLTEFLRAAFAEAIPVSTDAGLKRVVERAGLSWEEARPALQEDGWRKTLEENRLRLVADLGLWGVPSYRVSGPGGEPAYACWGNDRLWKVAREIRRRIESAAS